jgi:glycerol-3-phosphate dehydrogenase
METIRWAVAEGATVLNYVEAVELLQEGGRACGVMGRDVITGRLLEFSAPAIANCAGPWCGPLAGRLDGTGFRPPPPSIAFNVLYDRRADFDGAAAVTARRPGARTYFLRNWRGRVLAGTYHSPMKGGSPEEGPSLSSIEVFGRELDEAVPALGLSASPRLRVFGGQLPVKRKGTVQLSTRDLVHDHEVSGGPRGLFSVSGTKFTTSRRTAERLLTSMAATGSLPDLTETAQSRPTVRAPISADEITRLAIEEPEQARRVIGAIVSEEAVVHPDDLLLRRTDWGMFGRPHDALLDAVRELVPARPGQVSR